jgi:pantoate--beta-alanine ligase
MKIVETIPELRQALAKENGHIGLVPTMGYLHEGHLSLVRMARRENQCAVVSIFVNPTQFGVNEDLSSYPRDTSRDLKLLEREGVDYVFIPAVSDIYPAGFSTWVEVERVTERLEGASRPGHFRGVATVVQKLFHIVEPDRAYFGQKDAQQAVVIKKMVLDLNMNIDIVLGATVREANGLALSSRNSYLNSEERKAATVLYRALTAAKQMWQQGEYDANRLRDEMRLVIQQEPLAEINYVSIADSNTLEELSRIDRSALASLAVNIGSTRLIDNFLLE